MQKIGQIRLAALNNFYSWYNIMHIQKILEQEHPLISFEFFPPKTEKSAQTLFNSIKELVPLKPAYVSVTYGAGGSTRELTHDLVVKIQQETDLTVVSHLTCVGASKDDIKQLLQHYSDSGINNILALRGDPPKGQSEFVQPENGFAFASELVEFVKTNFPQMGVGVAGFPEGHPATPNRLNEIDYLKAKIDAGADYICTQLFFDNRDFYDFVERCHLVGIKVPIIAGIMPITSQKGMVRMAELALGARFPARLQRALARTETDEDFEKVGIHWATEQVRDLIDNRIDGIHFYTLNRSRPTLKIYEALGVKTSDGFARI